MKNKVKVSVILPSLNVIDYIEKCIESVINQTLKEIEIICVDAGSTDGTYEILQKYAANDNRVQVIHSDKKSYGYQVNQGVKAATGEYIAIVDTDDLIKSDMYESLYQIVEKDRVDFVKGNFVEIKEENGQVKVLQEIKCLAKEENYNKCINVQESLFIFEHMSIANWSGIYRREFLINSEIYHNETPGASYQDAGFWFQVYTYAQTAYFVNKAYYLYRLDNPNSSVASKGKIYCICDEFEFVLNRLCKDAAIDRVKDQFCRLFYTKYKWNLNRIDPTYREEFLKKFAEDFKRLDAMGLLNISAFDSESQVVLNKLMENFEGYYLELMEKRDRFMNKLQSYEKVIIYGAGFIGKKLYYAIADKSKVECFVVSSDSLEKAYEGKAILNINTLSEQQREIPIVIAIQKEEIQAQMKQTALEIGFQNIILTPCEIYQLD